MKKTNCYAYRCAFKFLLLMKLSIVLLLFTYTSLWASDVSGQRINLDLKEAPIEKVLEAIREQGRYSFVYQSQIFPRDLKINIRTKNASIDSVMDKLLLNTPLYYKKIDRNLFVILTRNVPPPVTDARRPPILVQGSVKDRAGGMLQNVSVYVKGTQNGTLTNEKGEFTLNANLYDSLEISSVGYKTQYVFIADSRPLIIVLDGEDGSMNEVAVVAFSKQKKASMVASITSIKPSELRMPSSNLTNSLAGRLAGMVAYQRSGEPGQDNAAFFIRGITSFGASAKKDPLILIDGIELSPNDLARLNPDDIASFSIMKDAMATALYGARGANGVILVTTKEGKEGKMNFDLRFENSFSSPTQRLETADPVTFMRMHNEAVKTRDPNGQTLYTDEQITFTEMGLHRDIYPATNWEEAMFKRMAINNRLNLSFTGGGSVARYYVAGSVTRDRGNLKVDNKNDFNSNIDLYKYSIRSNVNINLTKTTEMSTRFVANFDDYTGPIDGGSAMYRKVMQANPVRFKPFYEPDSNFSYAKHTLFGNFETGNYLNPYAEAMRGYRDYSRSNMLTTVELRQNLDAIAKGLMARALVNFDRRSEYSISRAYVPFYYRISSFDLANDSYRLVRLNPTTGRETLDYDANNTSRTVANSFYFEGATQYNNNFGKNSISGLLVFTARQFKQGAPSSIQLSLPTRNLSFSGRFSYDFDTRYLAEFAYGYNASERFAQNNRWGFFPSFGAGWVISNEPFFEPLSDVFRMLKLRGSYGIAGNEAIGSASERFFYLSEVNLNAPHNVNWGVNMNENPGGIDVSRYANDQVGWERSYKTNLALEFNLRNGFSSIIEIYKERRKNILQDRIMPATAGILPAVKANVGEAEGRGIDIELNYDKTIGKDLKFTGRGTFTYTTSKVIKWEEPDYGNNYWLSRIGTNLGQTWGLVAERLFIDSAEVKNSPRQEFGAYSGGDIKYKDINGDGKIDNLDFVPIGHPVTPEIIYGFGLSVSYKRFDFNFFFQGLARESFWLNQDNVTPFIDGDGGDGRVGQNAVLQAIASDYWSESNRNSYAFWPRLANYNIDNNRQTSTWFMQNGSFLRLKSVDVGYSFPPSMLKRFKVADFRIYFSGSNLLHWSAFKLWDPEMAGSGFDYPLQRVFNVGFNIGL
ncbi:TonB-dependent receptor [Niabella yanshanensis]|uniref:TonB-dependent receptor n=1 Tax=Niabella yanshanensis TaxID=577386 RepID=A0ABZ0W4H9_9BACT|nr:TonB-dependent receptor [Niabella yanshanensis]WQD38026.1 TonB-dependent receptor [Niabella yanshanensis]